MGSELRGLAFEDLGFSGLGASGLRFLLGALGSLQGS